MQICSGWWWISSKNILFFMDYIHLENIYIEIESGNIHFNAPMFN